MDLKLIKYIDRHFGIILCNLLGLIPSRRAIKNHQINKILIIKFSGFGNIVLALPTIRAIKEKYPNAEITFLTHTMNASLLESEPAINYIITMDIGKSTFKTFSNIVKFLLKFRKEDFDMILDLEQFSRFSTLSSFINGARIKAGFDTKGQGRGKLYDIKVSYNDYQHTSKTFADMAFALGAKVDFKDTRISLTKSNKEVVDSFLSKKGIVNKDILVGIHPGCGSNNPQRKWSKEKFSKLADFLIEKYGAKVFFTGNGPLEEEIIGGIMSSMKHKSFNSAGELNLQELSEIISRCKAFVSNDTGPLHITSAMGVPLIAFFGPNTPILYGPLPHDKKSLVFYKNPSCSPCTTNFNEKTSKCKHFKCIKNITFEEVKDKIEKSNLFRK